MEQVERTEELLDSETTQCAIIGGDFNTFSSHSIQFLEEKMAANDLVSVLNAPQNTVKSPLLDFTLDHLFVRGFEVIDAGTWDSTTASDHYPIWANLESCASLDVGT